MDARILGSLGRGPLAGFAVKLDRTFFGDVSPSHGFDQRGLARAIFAKQGVNFTRLGFEIDIVERFDTGKHFGDAVHTDHGSPLVCGQIANLLGKCPSQITRNEAGASRFGEETLSSASSP